MKDLFKQLELLGLNPAKTRGITTTVVDFVCDFYSEDRQIYVRVDKGSEEIIGVNYEYGIADNVHSVSCGKLDPCIHLTTIFERLQQWNKLDVFDGITKAIELYEIAFLNFQDFLHGTYEDGYRVNKED